jgi:two-component sensor histidine kinase
VEERTKQLLDANRRLEEEIAHRTSAEVRMRDSLTEKEALLQEVHHRVKNNLQIISSLLALQGAHVTDEKTLGVLRDSQSRIRSMAFIHEHLYRSPDLARIDFGQYIRDLMGALFQSYSEIAGRVSLKLEIEPAFLDVGTALPCGLIINEIVSNCLKHAFPEGRFGEVRVSLSRRSEDGFELLVQDDGIGFDGETELHRSASLGLRLVKNLTELQLKGSLQMSSDAGTRVKILFRDRR